MILPFGRLGARDRRAIVLGLAVLVPAFAWIGAIRPYRTTLLDVRERIAAERALLEREEALLASADVLPIEIAAAAEAARRAENRLVRAANRPLAEAGMTDYLEKMAGLSRVLLQEMRGVEPDPGTPEPAGLRPIRLSVRGESDLEGVVTFLQRLEESPLLLRVAGLSLEPVMERQRERRGDQAAALDVPTGVMRFAFVIEGFTGTETPAERPAISGEVLP